jgi:hypothetical protein
MLVGPIVADSMLIAESCESKEREASIASVPPIAGCHSNIVAATSIDRSINSLNCVDAMRSINRIESMILTQLYGFYQRDIFCCFLSIWCCCWFVCFLWWALSARETVICALQKEPEPCILHLAVDKVDWAPFVKHQKA